MITTFENNTHMQVILSEVKALPNGVEEPHERLLATSMMRWIAPLRARCVNPSECNEPIIEKALRALGSHRALNDAIHPPN